MLSGHLQCHAIEARCVSLHQVLLMSRKEFGEYLQTPQGGGGGGGGGRSLPSLIDMRLLEGAAEDDPDFCSDVCRCSRARNWT